MNIIRHYQICEVSSRTFGHKFFFHSVEFEEFCIKKIMNKDFEEFIVNKVLGINPEIWFIYFNNDEPVTMLGSVVKPKSVPHIGDGNMFKFSSEFGELNVNTKVYFGQDLESCKILDFDVSADFILNFIKFNKSKEDSFANYFEQSKLFKKVVTILVSHQKVAIQISGSSFSKTFSKNYDKTENIELNENQIVDKVGKRK
jgi:hypothetical protein